MNIEKKPPIREVDTLPEEVVLNEVILNKGDGFFYLGIETKEDKEHGCCLEETSVRSRCINGD